MYRIKLGQKVKDNISGFQGIAVCRMLWLHGCERISVQPPVSKDGKQSDPQVFDEPQLDVINEGVRGLTTERKPVHGDNTFVPEQH